MNKQRLNSPRNIGGRDGILWYLSYNMVGSFTKRPQRSLCVFYADMVGYLSYEGPLGVCAMTNEAPTPDEVKNDLNWLVDCGQSYHPVGLRLVSVRAHIAALEHKHADLVTRCVQAESDRDALEAKLAEQIREDEMRLINHCVKVLGNNSKAHIHAEAEFLTKIAELEAENKRLAAELDFTARRMKHEADERDKADDQNKRLVVALEWIAYTECLVYECQEKARAALAQTGEK